MKTLNDGTATSTITYDSTSEHRGVPTAVDTGMGSGRSTFTGSYDAAGQLSTQTFPNGMTAGHSYDNLGTPTGVTYTLPTYGDVDAGTLAFTATSDAAGQTVHAQSPLSAQDYTYDKAGRLIEVEDTVDGRCVTRAYGREEWHMDSGTPQDDPSFRQWLSQLTSDPEIDLDPADDTTQNWLREVHRDNGAVTTKWLHLLLFEHRRDLAEKVLDTIRRQAEYQVGDLTGLAIQAPEEPSPTSPSGLIAIDDVAIRGIDTDTVAVEVADGVQNYIAQALRQIWPQCPIHGNGLHPDLYRGEPLWICNQGPHPQRRILE